MVFEFENRHQYIDQAMISERALAEVHSSIWSELAPNLPRVIRSLNLSGRDHYAPPMKRRVAADRIYLLNELAYRLFLASENGHQLTLVEALAIVAANNHTDPASGLSLADAELSAVEIADVNELARRTRQGIPDYVRKSPQPMGTMDPGFEEKLIIPNFKGVGILDPCNGDAQFGNTIVEIKSGERDIRSIDLRQVIIYYILSVLEGVSPAIDRCLLLNPRQGYRFYFQFPVFMAAISGLTTVEFIANLRDYLVNWKACD